MRRCLALWAVSVCVVFSGCQGEEATSTVPPTETTNTAYVINDRRLAFDDLATLVRESLAARDEAAFARLIVGAPGQPADVENHLRIFRADADRLLENIEYIPLTGDESLEYTLDGQLYRPAVKPSGWMRLDLRTRDNFDSESNETEVTRMLVGVVQGEWWIIAAAPVTRVK
ncbi:MAG: hypothetical protein KDA92_10255 [Planctomycetales bacterium]|nr:hypothetical protein [Planctomycetales bacterium]MCA9167079.1 hypothetical protein [Planctomycetales bacterium]